MPGKTVKALCFDVFGTVTDWRGSVIKEGEALSARLGVEVPWGEFVNKWRIDGYVATLIRIASGEMDCIPTEASLQQLSQRADDSPVIMLNLLRFRPRGDSTIYSLYGKDAAPEVKKVGSFIGYYGAVVTDLDPALGFDASWDAVVMPVYHRRASYLALQRSSVYQLAIPYRSAGTSRRTLYVLSDGDKVYKDTTTIAEMDASRKPLPTRAGDVYVIDVLRFDGAPRWKTR